jgi:hypothetical protein
LAQKADHRDAPVGVGIGEAEALVNGRSRLALIRDAIDLFAQRQRRPVASVRLKALLSRCMSATVKPASSGRGAEITFRRLRVGFFPRSGGCCENKRGERRRTAPASTCMRSSVRPLCLCVRSSRPDYARANSYNATAAAFDTLR